LDIIEPYRVIPQEVIEAQADNILEKVKANRRRPLKNCDIAEAVADYFDLAIEWTDIKPDKEGEIAAMIIPTEKRIVLNEDVKFLKDSQNSSLAKEGFKNSTLAHEIGHWVLHINQTAVSNFLDRIDQGDYLETIQPFLCRTVNSSRGIEWQAQYFASCLLMPVSELEKAIKGRDLTKWKHLYAIAGDLGVTITNLKNRLESLHWIKIDQKIIYLGSNFPGKKPKI
jgi:Zn-dependent peptidase ImmA (M78 family)